MKPDTKVKLQKELNACATLNEMWAVLGRYYDLDKKLGLLEKPMAVHQLNSKIQLIAVALSIKEKTPTA